MAEHSLRYNRTNLIATLLCILSPVPLLVCVFLTENALPIMLSLAVTMLAAGIGAALYILVGVPHAAMQRLLREGEYAPGAPRLYSAVRTAYWLLALGVFLAWSFLGNAWHISWTVWAVAGILSGALEAILGAVGKRK